MRQYMARGMKREKVLAICGVTKDQFYYRPSGKKRGRKASRWTLRKMPQVGDSLVSNGEVVAHMKKKYENPMVTYGYRKMSAELQLDGFEINKKKV